MTKNYNPWRILSALCIGFFLVMVDQTIVAVATPDIKTALDADYNQTIWFTSAYLLTFCAPLLLSGRLGSYLGLRKLFISGVSIFTLGSLLCALSHTPLQLILARAIQGLGAALILPQSMTIIAHVFPAHQRGKAMGIWGAVAGVGSLIGPLAGGAILEWTSWHWIFLVNVPVGIIAVILTARWVPALTPDPTHSSQAMDIPGSLLSILGLGLTVYGLQEGEVRDWDSTTALIIASGIAILGLFIYAETKVSHPLLPLRLFRYKNFGKTAIAITTMGFGITGFAVPFMLYAQSIRHWSPIESGLLLLPMALAAAILAPVVGKLIDAHHPALITLIGYSAMSLGSFALGALLDIDTSLVLLIGVLVVLGIGNAFVWAPTSAVALRNVPQEDAGIGSGVYNTFRQLGAVIGSAATGALMQNRLAHVADTPQGTPPDIAPDMAIIVHNSARAFGESIYLSAAVFLIGIAAAALLRKSSA
ncbi:MFS transporter [Corynebacterium sp. sy039]|uniref:MFS transporter n=1 Tax=Corynebacterium sp. sy039 TaxID=2599641 RepID=UPI0011B5292B|nr:MFS transporter [Corynebacterium sp. sy039]QDZ41966.1 MFS transporter [Corynebacterium sp. sy039]